MSDLLMQIEQRAATMPWMPAVRFRGQIVSYGDLHRRIVEYDAVVSAHALSENAALTAALVSFFPDALRALAPLDQAQWVADAITWLSRGLSDSRESLIAAI
ncbi:hypothetical protein [Gordonia iterans]|nr:hypothetical protein [Gordonia iterans]